MMGWVQRLTAYVLSEVQGSRPARLAQTATQVLYHVGRKSWDDHFTRRAAALSFFTLLNLFPLAALILFILSHSLLVQSNVEAIESALVEQLVTPAAQQVVMDLFDSLSKNLSVLSKGVSGVVALAVLLLLGSSLILLVERSLNEIWRSPGGSGGSFLARVALLWMGVTLLPLLVAASFALSAHFKKGMPHFYWTAHYLLPYLVTFAAFFALYWFIPRVRLGFRAVAFSALLGAAFWEAAKQGLSAYVRVIFSQSAVEKLYGSLALFPIGMVWIYYSWVIVLFGAELAYVLHHRHRLQSEARLRQALERGFTPLSRRAAVALLMDILDAFDQGAGPVRPADLTARYQLHPEQVDRWLGALEHGGFVAKTPSGAFVSVMPAQAILVRDVARLHAIAFDAALTLARQDVRSWAHEEEEMFLTAFGDRTLADWSPSPAASRHPSSVNTRPA